MLKDFVKAVEPDEEELKKELKEAQEKLASYQMEIKNAKLPVIVIFEGWGAAGKGSVIGRVIKSIDPRFFRVRTMASPTEEEKRYPFLHRYLLEIPEAGKFTFFDTYWMNEVVTQHMEGELDENQYKHRVPQYQHRGALSHRQRLPGNEVLLPHQQKSAEKASGCPDGGQEHPLESERRRPA